MEIAAPPVPRPDPLSIRLGKPLAAPVTRQRRAPQKLSWVCDRPQVGSYLRRRREALGLTQDEVALAATTTVSSLRKWEAGLRNPSIESLAAWCSALDLPDWMLRKITSLALNGLDHLGIEPQPPTLGNDELDHLETVTAPAYYLIFPHLDILAANYTARRLVPSLVPATPGSSRPTNLVEWVMTTPAREILVDWQTIATQLVYLLRVMGPGLVPQQRLDEIFNFCHSQAPREFTRFFSTELTKAETNNTLIRVRNTITGAIEQHTYQFLHPVQPRRAYEQLQIVKRSATPGPGILGIV
ncbi:helix-turn-helix domain-containing protein [Nocardia vaccinii]|uniref:helix-turn-helix domain-containing protein n=1 Tax=Nocardia vaccinii TaxID=1822 RepID=UPI000A0029D6|nr:helix-turn-helix domain-containing protein [Nocardia vaccinii]